jgi:multiple sugar transport system ATP-binding protein
VSEIVFDEVSKIFDDGTMALDSFDLTVPDGKLVVLVGPSGCGKTTALRLVAGLEELTDGSIRMGGRVLDDVAPKDRDVAMVFQNYALYPHMSVFQNMALALKLRRVQRDDIRRRVQEVAVVLGIQDLLDRSPRQLSGGQRQRVAMGRAIVREPQAFLMDEPLSNLDAKLRVQMRSEILRIQRDLGVTTIFVTHDQVEALTMGDLVVVMADGVLQQVGAAQEIYDRPDNVFVARFIGSPTMNMVEARLLRSDEGLHLDFGSHSLPLVEEIVSLRPELQGYLGKDIILGIRPEGLEDPSFRGMPSEFRLRVRPDLIESLGSQLLVHFVVDARGISANGGGDDESDGLSTTVSSSTPFVAQLPSSVSMREGTVTELSVNTSGLHFFDPTTRTAIR